MKHMRITREQIGQGRLVLINRQHSIQDNRVSLHLVTGGAEDIFLEKEAATVLERIFEHLNLRDEIVPVSGFRSRASQERIYRESLLQHGQAYTSQFVALPGCSEHESGLAIDLSLEGEKRDIICPSFPYEGVAQAFREAAPYFGYIERYEKDKQSITGIGHEPWHFRYVGYPHSLIMKERKLSMEEYVELLRKNHGAEHPFLYTSVKERIRIFYQNMEEDYTLIHQEDETVSISGDNIDGCIITITGGSYED